MLNCDFQSHLDVFDSTADQTAGLERIPGHIKDLQERRSVSQLYVCGEVHSASHLRCKHLHTDSGLMKFLTLSECPVAVARTRPLLQSQIHNVFLASRPTDASRYKT